MTGPIVSMPAPAHALLSGDLQQFGLASLVAAVVLPVEAAPRASAGRHGG